MVHLPQGPRVASRRWASPVVIVVLLREPIRAKYCDECHAGVAHALRSSHKVHVRGIGSRTMLSPTASAATCSMA